MKPLFLKGCFVLAVFLLSQTPAPAAEDGWLGITVQNVSPQMAFGLGLGAPRGAMVTMVRQGGPAARSGLIQGDIIIGFNGEPVDDVANLRRFVTQSTRGSSVKLKVVRNRREMTLSVVLGQAPQQSA